MLNLRLLLPPVKKNDKLESLPGTVQQKTPCDMPAVKPATSSVRRLPAVYLGFLFKAAAITSYDRCGDRFGV